MGIGYGQQGYIVTDSDIDSVTYANMNTINFNGNDDSGKFKFNCTTISDVCSTQGGFTVNIKDVIPWTMISYKVKIIGFASCWNFNQVTNYNSSPNNILSWSPALGDKVIKCLNSFEQPQFAIKMNACDNNADNFLHGTYHTGNPKEFTVIRRRADISNGLAGPSMGVTCSGAVQLEVSQIVIW